MAPALEVEVREIMTLAATLPNIGMVLFRAGQSVGGAEASPRCPYESVTDDVVITAITLAELLAGLRRLSSTLERGRAPNSTQFEGRNTMPAWKPPAILALSCIVQLVLNWVFAKAGFVIPT